MEKMNVQEFQKVKFNFKNFNIGIINKNSNLISLYFQFENENGIHF